MALTIPMQLLPFAVVFADALDGDDVLVFGGADDDHALCRPPRLADVADGAADELAAVGHEHDLIRILDRERGNERAVAAVPRHGGDALPAAAGDAVFVTRSPLAVAIGRDGEDELLGGAELGVALLR